MEGLTPGRIVHYTLGRLDEVHDDVLGERRAAIITNVRSKEAGVVDLYVFLAGPIDTRHVEDFDGFRRSDVRYQDPTSLDAAGGFWHWIERA